MIRDSSYPRYRVIKAVDIFYDGLLKIQLIQDAITNIAADVILSSADTELSIRVGVFKRIIERGGIEEYDLKQ
ncbi:hypothetical protein FIM08_00830 [SAR202 cluster bacterium AC-647-N09_OGT_505m]|nr:hypothetical protein [SAR202 cluster bacterium AC-647-N09_OGT_505m]